MQEERFRATLGEEGRAMLDRLSEMQRASNGFVEYSLNE
jgi:hypothetical protein